MLKYHKIYAAFLDPDQFLLPHQIELQRLLHYRVSLAQFRSRQTAMRAKHSGDDGNDRHRQRDYVEALR